MRYLLITLMIVLLPLRGWAGNAMAVDMAAQQMLLAQVTIANSAAMVAESSMPADCPMLVQAVADKPEQASPASVHCHSCDTCELCLALAASTLTAWPADMMNPPDAPLLVSNAFQSANTAAGFKPPIS